MEERSFYKQVIDQETYAILKEYGAGFEATDDASASVSYARDTNIEEEIKQMELETKKRAEESILLSDQGMDFHQN